MGINAKHNQSAEDYLESILMLSRESEIVHRIDVAKRMGVSQAAVNKAVKLLCEKEYVYEDGKHLYLTEKGRMIDNSIRRRIVEEEAVVTSCLSDEEKETLAKILSKIKKSILDDTQNEGDIF